MRFDKTQSCNGKTKTSIYFVASQSANFVCPINQLRFISADVTLNSVLVNRAGASLQVLGPVN